LQQEQVCALFVPTSALHSSWLFVFACFWAEEDMDIHQQIAVNQTGEIVKMGTSSSGARKKKVGKH
jgi:hypothetical protein